MGNYILEGKTAVLEKDVVKWAKWMNDADRHVAQYENDEGVRVSTVFLGIDHSFGGDGPVLFETMVFGGDNDEFQDRYSTWEEAKRGHDRVVKMSK